MIIDNLKTFCIHSLIGFSVLATGCSNSLDLRGQQKDKTEAPSVQSSQVSSLALSEAASAVRYLNQQEMLQDAEPQQVSHIVPAAHLIKDFAGRYTGHIPCVIQSQCDKDKVDIALTLLPDGTAVRTLVQQGKVNSMLEKETAVWTVAGNGKNILLILPNREVWSFKREADGKLRFEPQDSATINSALSAKSREYILTAANI